MRSFTNKLVRRSSDKHFEQILAPMAKTCAISLNTPKTAALVFEKLYTPVEGENSPPVELMTYPENGKLKTFPAYTEGGVTPSERSVQIKFVQGKRGVTMIAGPTRDNLIFTLGKSPDALCAKIETTGFRPVLCYPRHTDSLKPFQAGDYPFVVACLTNLQVVDEQRLTWDQVMELRRDRQSRADLIRFLNWLNEDMVGKSQAYIQDRLAFLYESQQSALRKFGISTYANAAGEAVLAHNPKSLITLASGGALSAVSSQPLFLALSAGIALTSSVYASIKKMHCTLQRERDAMAFFYGLKKATTTPPPTSPDDADWQQGSDAFDW